MLFIFHARGYILNESRFNLVLQAKDSKKKNFYKVAGQ